MEDGTATSPPLSITEFEEWQAFFTLRAERLEQHREEMRAEMEADRAKGAAKGAGAGKLDLDPPVIGSGRKKARGR